MTTSKELLLRDKELCAQLAAVTNAHWFSKCLLYVRGELMQADVTAETLRGAKLFENILMTIASENSRPPEPLRSGLQHDLDRPKPNHQTKKA